MKASAILLAATLATAAVPASAAPFLLVDATSGDILAAREATRSWHPASLTKMMTAHLALSAVKAGRLRMDAPVVMTPHAASQAPTKLGLKPGQSIRLGDALRLMMVRSTNDVAVAIAETVAGSEDAFVTAMNEESIRLGMSGTRFANANGLHDDRQVTNARDMAILLLAMVHSHPDHADLFRTPAMSVAGRQFKNTNKLVGSYAGLEATKTGYVCASGFNVAVSAIRGGRRVVGVVMGAPTAASRNEAMKHLLDAGLAWKGETAGNLRTVRASAPTRGADLRPFKCGRGGVPAPALADLPREIEPAKPKAASAGIPAARPASARPSPHLPATPLPPRRTTEASKSPVQRF